MKNHKISLLILLALFLITISSINVQAAGCTVDADCDDTLFCNGAEICFKNNCEPGIDPCPGEGCEEEKDVCIPALLPDGTICTGNPECQSGYCRADYSSPLKYCAASSVACVHDGDQFANFDYGPDCAVVGGGGIVGQRWMCLAGVWRYDSCGTQPGTCTDTCTLDTELNACSNGVPRATCDVGGAGSIPTNVDDLEYCDGGSILSCSVIHPESCISGAYITEADANPSICACAGKNWDFTLNQCCGDDGTSDNWDSASGTCDDGIWYPADTGYNPVLGCWGVTLCDGNFTCGVYDGVCPEDFFPPEGPQTCSSYDPFLEGYLKCLDPDCRANITGHVISDGSQEPIPGAEITYEQDVWNGTTYINLTQVGYTIDSPIESDNGTYWMNIGAGNNFYIIARAQGYTADIKGPFFNLEPETFLEVNFTLRNGSCQGDCTREGSNYCDANCQGQGVPGDTCWFNDNTTFLTDIIPPLLNITSPLEACTQLGVQQGSVLDIGSYTNFAGTNMCIKVRCCEGIPFEVPCPQPDIGSDLDNAIRITRIANYKGEAVKIRLYYWE
ncbi:hypothetical protein ISS09_02075 [Candidatus Woesearchaeota archaeon]|nr:hypothetical protein [Candidatus Woesearchaeota archaeon]